MINGSELKMLLQTQAFAPVSFPLTRTEIARVVQGTFMNFLELPYNERALLTSYADRPEFRNSLLGFVQRDPKDGYDDKVYLHYRPEMETHFADVMKTHPLIGGLMEELRPLYKANAETFRNVIEQFEDEHPGVTQSFFPLDAIPTFYLRLLAYLGDDCLAQPHVDIAAAALANAESGPGLYLGFDKSHVTHVVHENRQAFFFPGYTFPDETSDLYPPAWHGAEQLQVHAKKLTPLPKRAPMSLAEQVSRWAVVCFFHGSKRRTIPREDAHRPHPFAVERARALATGWEPNLQPLVAAGE